MVICGNHDDDPFAIFPHSYCYRRPAFFAVCFTAFFAAFLARVFLAAGVFATAFLLVFFVTAFATFFAGVFGGFLSYSFFRGFLCKCFFGSLLGRGFLRRCLLQNLCNRGHRRVKCRFNGPGYIGRHCYSIPDRLSCLFYYRFLRHSRIPQVLMFIRSYGLYMAILSLFPPQSIASVRRNFNKQNRRPPLGGLRFC